LLTRCHKGSVAASLVSTAEAYFNDILGKYRQASFLVAPSRFLLERMVEVGIPREKLRHIPNGVDHSHYTPVFTDHGYFLYVGRLSPEKGLRTLLDASRRTRMPLRIVGEGPDQLALKQWAAEHKAVGVSFEGHKSGDELECVIRGAAFVVVPSEWYENASMSVLEGMAYGKPIIASRIGGLPEQVEDGQTGLLFEPGNADELLQAIESLAADRSLRRSMGQAARKRLEIEYSLDRHCAALTSLYREAIQAGASPHIRHA
jgi:glycosyltransferase involved in cell wall biosynthesis